MIVCSKGELMVHGTAGQLREEFAYISSRQLHKRRVAGRV